jgi:hypothetical protein
LIDHLLSVVVLLSVLGCCKLSGIAKAGRRREPDKKSRYRLARGQTIDRILVKLDYLIIYLEQES